MIGYHYTSLENFDAIRMRGLRPYPILKPNLTEMFGFVVHGIFVWVRELTPAEHLGSLIWQIGARGSTKLVRLRVEYDPAAELRLDGCGVAFSHNGECGAWRYHVETPATILVDPVGSDSIVLLEEYDLEELVSVRRRDVGRSIENSL